MPGVLSACGKVVVGQGTLKGTRVTFHPMVFGFDCLGDGIPLKNFN